MRDFVVVRAVQGLLAGCLALLLSGCTSPISDQAAGAVQELACGMNIDQVGSLPTDYRSELGAIALPAADVQAEAIAPVLHGDQGALRYFAKFGLLVHSTSEFTVQLQHPPEVALMGWGTGDHATYSTLRSGGCEGSGWKVYAGGLWVSEPMCVELRVDTPESSEVVSVAVGARCG